MARTDCETGASQRSYHQTPECVKAGGCRWDDCLRGSPTRSVYVESRLTLIVYSGKTSFQRVEKILIMPLERAGRRAC